MGTRLLLNTAQAGDERAALVVNGRLTEFLRERTDAASLVGNVYRGRVVNLESGIAAAFLDIGVGRNGFLHVSDCGAGDAPADARIEDHAAMGDEIIVQVTRDAVSSKGPVLTTQVGLPGRFLVLLPCGAGGGISRRIEETEDRTKLRALATELEARAGCGIIFRTASVDRERAELERDLEVLCRRWEAIVARTDSAPVVLHEERDLVTRALRDLADASVGEVLVDTPATRDRVRALLPEMSVTLHAGPAPLFHAFDIEEQVDTVHARRVALPGGGSIVFDRTEALVAVDVNTGRARDEGMEETTHRVNLEAAREIARQLRLRDLGGVVAVDFIDVREAEHVRELERTFKEHLRRDRARVRPGRMGPFAIFVLTRQRAGDGVADSGGLCPCCGGAGRVAQPEDVALRVYRELLAQAPARARVSPAVAAALQDLGEDLAFEADESLAPDGWIVER